MRSSCLVIPKEEIIMPMGRPRVFPTADDMWDVWEEYKADCNKQIVKRHVFSAKNSEFVSADLECSIPYCIEGFCDFAGISRQAFHKTYSNHPDFADVVLLIRESCEVDARKKFELGILPTQLAGLWMAKYGYTTKVDAKVDGPMDLHVVIDYGDSRGQQ